MPDAPLRRDVPMPVSYRRPASAIHAVAPTPARRGKPVLRGYEIAYLAADGRVRETTGLAPATDRFEQCFAALGRGALLTTGDGPRAIEDLWPGDLVMTTSHGMQPILWRGQTQVQPGAGARGSSLSFLLRLTQNALGPGRPTADLLLGPAARLARAAPAWMRLDGVETILLPAHDLVDGDSMIELHPASTVEVYQLGLPHPALLAVGGGLEVASLHPGPAEKWPRRAGERKALMALFPHLSGPEAFGPPIHPHVDLRDLEIGPT